MLLEFGSSDAVEFWDLGIGWLAGLGPAALLDPGLWDLGFGLSALRRRPGGVWESPHRDWLKVRF